MKLIYKDPCCSGLQVIDCPSRKDIKKVLAKVGMDEDNCGGEIVYYVFVAKDGKVESDSLDFT